MILSTLLTACVFVILLICFFYIRHTYTIWSRCNIPFDTPSFPFGNVRDVGSKVHMFEFITGVYERMKHKSPISGLHILMTPAVVLTNLDLIKQILIKDFNCFMNRGMYVNLRDDPLSGNIFNLDGSKWKLLRAKLTSTFTSGKMKMIFPTVVEKSNTLMDYISDVVSDNNVVEINISDTMARYTIDVIGAIALGITCNSLKYDDAEFLRIGKMYFKDGRQRGLKHFFRVNHQRIARLLGLTETPKPVTDFFLRAVKETVEHREATKTKHRDLIDLLIQLKNNGKLEDDENLNFITFDEAAAQAFVFFSAGYETTKTTLSYCLYELAKNQGIQDKTRKHIQQVLQKNGTYSYDMLSEFKYLDQVINETLRQYPAAPILFRAAEKDYNISNTCMVIPKGTLVMVPIYGIHHDADIYENPDEFDPNRFSDEQINTRHSNSFMGFGDGPRSCIAIRFALMEMKITLIDLVTRYRFTVCSKTNSQLKFDKKMSTLTTSDIWLNVEKNL